VRPHTTVIIIIIMIRLLHGVVDGVIHKIDLEGILVEAEDFIQLLLTIHSLTSPSQLIHLQTG